MVIINILPLDLQKGRQTAVPKLLAQTAGSLSTPWCPLLLSVAHFCDLIYPSHSPPRKLLLSLPLYKKTSNLPKTTNRNSPSTHPSLFCLFLPRNPYLLPAPLGLGTRDKLIQPSFPIPTSYLTLYSDSQFQIPSQK